MRAAGARLVPVAMAEGLTGWDLERWRQVLREAAPRLAYVVADFHNPTGALADEDQRRRLVELARSAGTVVVVDETMSELVLDEGTALPRPVCGFDPAGSTVITVGSASKAFWAGMRIGWVRAAPDVIRSLIAARAYADLGTPVLEQLAVNWLLSTGGWEQAVAQRCVQARENRDALVAAVRRELPDWEFEVPHGGLTLWVRTGGLSGSRLAEAGSGPGSGSPRDPASGWTAPSRAMSGCRSPWAARWPRRRRAGWPPPRTWSAPGRRGRRSRRGPSWREDDGRAHPSAATGSEAARDRESLVRRPASSAPGASVRAGSRASTASRSRSPVASSYGSGVAGTCSRWTGPAPSRAYPARAGRPWWGSCAAARRGPP